MPTADPAQVRALVAALRPQDRRTVLAIRADPVWSGPEVLDGSPSIRVVPVRSPLAAREALVRHLEKDLGAMAFPQLPAALVPFTIAEFSPMPMTQFHDDRQHAVALEFIVPVTGECEPRQDALEVTWVTPEEAKDPDLLDELEGGRGKILRAAIGHLLRW